jgi:hypothetical protein
VTARGPLADVPARVLVAAAVIGVLPELEELMVLAADRVDVQRAHALAGGLLARINLATLDVAATRAEIDCERRRAWRVRQSLHDSVSRRARDYGIVALLAGAVSGMASASLSLAERDRTGDLVGLSGAILGLALGVAAISVRAEAQYWHPRNHLRGLWYGGPDGALFPESLRRFLDSDAGQGLSARRALVQRWKERQLGTDDHAVLLGDGGRYDADVLDLRVEMLEELGAELALFNRDLRQLMQLVLGSAPRTFPE